MLNAILNTLSIMGWLGIILGILVILNVTSGTLANVWSNEEDFSWSRMFQGLIKALVFYVSAVFLSIALTMLPFINDMVTDVFGTMLISSDTLTTLSGVGVVGVVLSTIVIQAKKAINNVLKLANLSSDTEEITWDVVDPDTESEEEE